MNDLSLITRISARPVDLPLRESFAISQGVMTVAANVFVRVELRDGSVGYGEAAPFTAITGEDQSGTLAAINGVAPDLEGHPALRWRLLSKQMAAAAPQNPAARCALETAIIDAACRHLKLPMHCIFGGAEDGPLETDITIPIVGRERSLELADHWHEQGFRILKIKIGRDLDSDIGTIQSIAAELPDVSFVLDANQGFTEHEALRLVSALDRARVPVRILEQPIAKDNLKAMMTIRRAAPFQVCADESVASRSDAMQVIRADAADIINIKIMKCGVVESMEIAALAHANGIGVMYGGMIESRVAMGCSLALAAGLGSPHTLDLDTPLLLADDLVEGGYAYAGAMMSIPPKEGLGCTLEHLFSD